jgi:maleate isomerase
MTYGWRAKVGIIVPSGNSVSEPQFRMMAPPGVEFFAARLRLEREGPDRYLKMAEGIEDAAGLLADLRPSFILFHCTAVSVAGGVGFDDQIAARIERSTGCPGGATVSGVVQALHALDARRIALITPYAASTNALEVAFLEGHGFEVTTNVALDTLRERRQQEPGEWYRIVREHYTTEADAVFLSCTAVRTIEVINWLEQDLGVPVVTSNQGALWYVLRRLGIRDRVDGYGRLLREYPELPAATQLVPSLTA